MHGVIPAAGTGSRLGSLTDDRPKPMVPVAGRPLIEYPLDRLVETGIDELVVVIGHRGDAIIEHLGDGYRDVPITYVHQRDTLGLADAIGQAQCHVDGGFVVCNADNVFGGSITPAIEPMRDGSADGAILVEEVDQEAARETGVVDLDDGLVTRIVEKPADPTSTLATTGCYVLPEAVFHACALVRPSATGEYELSEAVSLLARAGYAIAAVPLTGWRVNVNTAADIDRAERLLAT